MPSFVGILEGINIRLLCPVVVTVEHQEDSQAENNESKDKEEPANQRDGSFGLRPNKNHNFQGFFAVKRRAVFILVAKWKALVRGWRRECVVGGMETCFQ